MFSENMSVYPLVNTERSLLFDEDSGIKNKTRIAAGLKCV